MPGMWDLWGHRRVGEPDRGPRRGWRRSWVVAATAGLLVAGLPIAGQAQEPPVPPSRSADAVSTADITLVTGDVVTVTTLADGQQIADVDRPDGAVGGVRLQEIDGDLYVIPDEAVALLGADRARPAAVQRHRPDRDGLRRREHRQRAADRDLRRGRRRAPAAARPAPAGQRAGPHAAGDRRCRARRRRQAAGPHVLDQSIAPRHRPRRPDAGARARGRRSSGSTAGSGQPQGERPADRRARGLGGRLRRHGRQGRGARHRRRLSPPRPRRPDRRHASASSPARTSPTSTGTAPTSPSTIVGTGRRVRRRLQGRRARRRPDRRQGARRTDGLRPGLLGASPAWSGRPSPAPMSST